MEKPLDWYAEAESVIRSETSLLDYIDVSSLTASDGVYLNIKTLENQKFCVLLNNRGFRVVAITFDQDNNYSRICYETQSALLSNISKDYCQKFNESVVSKLNKLSESCIDKNNCSTKN